MSAANLAKDLLHEVEEERLDTFLCSLHHRCGRISTTFELSPLDRLVDIFRNDAISRHQQSAQRNAAEDGRSLRSDAAFTIPPSIVEITGITPCSGKTQLLHFLIALALLPPALGDIMLSGRDSAVVLLDMTNRFSILRLRDVIRNHILAQFKDVGASPPSDTEISSTVHAALKHLHIFHPESTPSLLETLKSLPSYLLAKSPSHFSASRSLGLVAISDSTAFLAQDRLDSESDSETLPPPAGTTAPPSVLESRHAAIVHQLDYLRTKFSSPIILTSLSAASPSSASSSSNNNNPSSSSHPSIRPPLPVIYSTIRTLHLLVQRNKVAKFGPGMSVEEAQAEKAQRWDAVRRAGFGVSVNWWGSGAWSQDVRAGLRGFNAGGSGDGARGGGGGGGGGGGWRFWVNGKDGEGAGFVHE